MLALFIENFPNSNRSFNFLFQVPMESRVQLRSKQFQFFDDDDDETGESHTIFMGPVEKWENSFTFTTFLNFFSVLLHFSYIYTYKYLIIYFLKIFYSRLIVYPPPPAKGGISVTNEDLHCLSEGEFLNDVIIDFYLK